MYLNAKSTDPRLVKLRGYTPAQVEVHVGDHIVFTNVDDEVHTATLRLADGFPATAMKALVTPFLVPGPLETSSRTVKVPPFSRTNPEHTCTAAYTTSLTANGGASSSTRERRHADISVLRMRRNNSMPRSSGLDSVARSSVQKRRYPS